MKLLYVCTHNRCRSILSEAITNHLAGPRLQARSAGSQPAGVVHPLSLFYLEEAGIPTQGLKSQSWDEFTDYAPDLVITVCDNAANETCPAWLGKSQKIHWGLADPSKVEGTDDEIASAFRQTIAEISRRTQLLLALCTQNVDITTLKAGMQKMGAG